MQTDSSALAREVQDKLPGVYRYLPPYERSALADFLRDKVSYAIAGFLRTNDSFRRPRDNINQEGNSLSPAGKWF